MTDPPRAVRIRDEAPLTIAAVVCGAVWVRYDGEISRWVVEALPWLLVLRARFARPEARAPTWYRTHGDPVAGQSLRLRDQPVDAASWTAIRGGGAVTGSPVRWRRGAV